LERVRCSFRLHVYGYVVMPEHVHLLLSEPRLDTPNDGTAPLKPKDGLNGPPSARLGFPTGRMQHGLENLDNLVGVEISARHGAPDRLEDS